MSTIQSEIRAYAPAIAFDAFISRKKRRILLRVIGGIELVLLCVLMGYAFMASLHAEVLVTQVVLTEARFFTALFLILMGPWSVLFISNLFYNTLYFRGLQTILTETYSDVSGITMEAAQACYEAKGDLAFGFLMSPYGRETLFRLGIAPSTIDAFLKTPRDKVSENEVIIPEHTFLSLHDIGSFLYERDTAFSQFLFSHGVTEDIFLGASEWVSRVRLLHKNHIRWWSRDNLGKIRGVGREFSFGVAYELRKYMRDINTTSALSLFINDSAYANEVIAKIEAVLARSKSANVLLVGDPGVGTMDLLIELGKRMREGKSVASLEAKRLIVFDTDAFIATHNSKEQFEIAFLTLMAQAVRAGNIILVIEQFNAFIESASALGVNGIELMDRFLNAPHIQVVATVDPGTYHQSMETKQQLLQYFSPVLVEHPDMLSVVRVLEDVTWGYEHDHHVFFTYPAIVHIAESADRYIVDGVMPDKAVSLMAEIAARAEQSEHKLILENFVDEVVRSKTGIPTGPIDEGERDILLNLENVLHDRVVGQHDAVRAIASAMRRARAGIQSSERPIASFLFLGSTGVGKTETAKALAHTFFGAEDRMLRFDMSEFSGHDALVRLIGSPDEAGALSSALREHPYAVVLLDEFEKSSKSVHDLFLQILDEGKFTDARGVEINARNSIFIATSNAGSDLIFELIQSGKRPADHRDHIIDSIIERGIYKPELINRFDAVILFETLDYEAQKEIARLMLGELATRMRERGYELVIDDVLVNVIVKRGFDIEYGARPLRRAIQDILEERIAQKVIADNLPRGSRLQFTEKDFEGHT